MSKVELVTSLPFSHEAFESTEAISSEDSREPRVP